MLDLLEQQKSLTINQWRIFTARVFSIVIGFFDFALIGFVLAFFVKDCISHWDNQARSCLPRVWQRYRAGLPSAGSATRSAVALFDLARRRP